MSEAETLAYKRSLVAEYGTELSPDHKYRLFMHPARTRAELDAALEEYRSQYGRAQIEPGWSLRYRWQGEERQGQFRNRDGVDRVRVSDLIPLPDVFVDGDGASRVGSSAASAGGASDE